MNSDTSFHSVITSSLVPEEERLSTIERLFGMHFPLAIEPFIYDITRHISDDYTGGYWSYYTLSNGGFFMQPEYRYTYHAVCNNGFTGNVSEETLGITACLYTYSNLSFSKHTALSRVCANHYHRLREFAIEHPNAQTILRATD